MNPTSVSKLLIEASECNGLRDDQIAILTQFVPSANLTLLENSLKELRGVAKKENNDEFISRLHRVYYRKIGEQSVLYPLFHIFESSFRTYLALWMEHHYQTPEWWRPHLIRLRQMHLGHAFGSPITKIGALDISHAVSSAIENFVRNVEGERGDKGILEKSTPRNVFEHSKLSDVEILIHEQWPAFKAALPSSLPNGTPLTQNGFNLKFKYVREARNVCYHHREVNDRKMLFNITEELLDLIDLHLISSLEYSKLSVVKKIQAGIEKVDRHRTLMNSTPQFLISYTAKNKMYEKVQVTALCSGDAITTMLDALSMEERLSLTNVTATPYLPVETQDGIMIVSFELPDTQA